MLFGKDNIKPSTTENYRYKETKEEKRKWYEKYGTASDWTSIFIGTLVAGFTIALFYQTKEATKNSKDAVAEAKRANDISKSGTDSSNRIARDNYNLSKSVFDSSIASGKAADIRADSALSIQKQYADAQNKSVEAQIKSLKETEKQFRIQNEPFLQIGSIFLDSPIYANAIPLRINIPIHNLKNVPVQIKKIASALNVGKSPLKITDYERIASSVMPNDYVTKESPYIKGASITHSFDEIMSLNETNQSVFIFTNITYTDLSTNIDRFYISILDVKIVNDIKGFRVRFNFIYNKNGYTKIEKLG